MPGEFRNVAEAILRRAADGGITAPQILDIISAELREKVNCYPGIPDDECYDLAIFISLSGRLKKGRGHYWFGQILEEFVQHFQGRCAGKTLSAVIITDSWVASDYEKWQGNIEAIRRSGVYLETYLICYPARISMLQV